MPELMRLVGLLEERRELLTQLLRLDDELMDYLVRLRGAQD
jgi:hypothetical protein